MALSRTGVYCTEPYRVPLAGKVRAFLNKMIDSATEMPPQLTHCLFDKTGTLTTDTLVPVGAALSSRVVHAGVETEHRCGQCQQLSRAG